MDIQPHIFFFPFMAHGHTIPTIEMAKLFASRGCKATIVSTPANSPDIIKSIERSRQIGLDIEVVAIKFPSKEVGLPEGCENASYITSSDMMDKFLVATTMLEQPLEQLLLEHRPTCLVAGVFFPWANQTAAKFGIPRLVFHGTSYFALCADASLSREQPHKKILSDTEPFVIPNLPDEIKITRQQLAHHMKEESESEISAFVRKVEEAEATCFGIIFNSYYELEPAYADHYRNFLGRNAWHIGPTFLCNEGRGARGQESSVDEHECLKWLDSKKPNSVVYVSFGSVAKFNDAQLMEIAMGLEASGKQFIWVVKKGKRDEESREEEWLPEGFEKRMEGKGLIIRGWAPQLLILQHEAVGGFVTHCGWNSTLEGVCSGVPMVTWPVSAEQFYNEKFVTQILRIGIGVGAEKWVRLTGDSVKRENVEKAVNVIMDGEEAEEMRSRAKALQGLAYGAVKEGGSSFTNLASLIEELKLYCPASGSTKKD